MLWRLALPALHSATQRNKRPDAYAPGLLFIFIFLP
jgi:hypothetical protein